MHNRHKALIGLYVLIAVGALALTWSHNIAFMRADESASATSFVEALFVNHAAASITWDIVFLTLACIVFMVVESKRLGIRFAWVYIGLSFVTAISVMFPLFLITRQLAMARLDRELTPSSSIGAEPGT